MTATATPALIESALAFADSLHRRRDVARRWCEQVGGPAPASWQHWAQAHAAETAGAAQRWDAVCRYLPVELIHAAMPHYLVLAGGGGPAWRLHSVHVGADGALKQRPSGAWKYDQVAVVRWDPEAGAYEYVEGSHRPYRGIDW